VSVYCQAQLHYRSYEAEADVPVTIMNGREQEGLSWQDQGFELIQHESAVSDWQDPAQIELHYEEITELARSLTGCDKVLFFPALVRSPQAAARHADLNPISLVHSDYTESYRDTVTRPGHPYHNILKPFMEKVGLSDEAFLAARRVLTLQLWRNIGPLEPDCPLCFCDANSVDREELLPILVPGYNGLETQFESFICVPPVNTSKHQWYTFPAMKHDEVAVFRAFDSDRVAAGQRFWTLHTAFRDPVAGDSAPPRQSVEMRAICVFLDD